MSCRVLVLISGNGSNLQAIIDQCHGRHGIELVGVISNKPDAYGLQRAQHADIATSTVIVHKGESRESYDARLTAIIDEYRPDLIVLAGFMRILSEAFVNRFLGRMLNIHPSLLPKYTGLDTHQRAIDAGDSEHGASVHFVTPELDSGPLVLQAKVPIYVEDDADILAQRVHEQEHAIYPLVIKWFATGRLQMKGSIVYLDGVPVGPAGYAPD